MNKKIKNKNIENKKVCAIPDPENDNVVFCPRCGYPVLREDLPDFGNRCPRCGYCMACDYV